MDNLKASFEEVADWCEKHLESQRGREIGMIFGTVLRAYGRLAMLPSHLSGAERAARILDLNATADQLLLEFSRRFHPRYGWVESRTKLADGMSMRTNMIYDPGARPGDERREKL